MNDNQLSINDFLPESEKVPEVNLITTESIDPDPGLTEVEWLVTAEFSCLGYTTVMAKTQEEAEDKANELNKRPHKFGYFDSYEIEFVESVKVHE